MSKVVVITGASGGLGLKTAVLFAKQGFKVYATMRNLEKKSQLLDEADAAGITVSVSQLDVIDADSIHSCVETIIAQEGRIDIWINNAGAGFAKHVEHATEEDMKWVTDVNYFGVVRCLRAVIPHMREQKSGHIINITSVGGLVGQPFNELYCGAKFAVEGYMESLATVLPKYFGIRLSLVEPGGISTGFSAAATEATMGTGLPEDAYLPIFQAYIAGFQKRGAEEGGNHVYQTPEEVAEVVLKVAASDDPPLRVRTSAWGEELCRFKTAGDADGMKQTNDVVERFLE